MASTNKTTNYELSQFVETDRPAWLTDYNGDMRTIDSTMKAISDVASGASGSISELAARMSTAEGNITTNTNDIAALDARADALEAGAQSQAGTIANIQTEQITQNAGIEAAMELGYNLARPYDSASTYAVGAYVLFQNTLYKCTTAVSTGEAFDPAKWLAIKATDEIASDITHLETIPNSDVFEIQSGDIATSIPTGNAYKYGQLLFVDLTFNFNLITQSIPISNFMPLAHLKSNYQPIQYYDGRANNITTATNGEINFITDFTLSNATIYAKVFKVAQVDISYASLLLRGVILLSN